ncbi:MAG: adenylate kinase [Solirubrobacteraceae bacterium]|jgi:adenylate kinase|nr:adenylate kinase [Solirubrobacteraceae bacterium]MEA2359298.1 adenylate kinase [Solirubrobacteraceae bacterium]
MPGSRFLRRSEVHANSPVSTVSELNLILLGPPGAGKGTQAGRLQEDFEVAYIATGDILRKAVKEGTELGQKAKAYMDKGDLVPDEVIIAVILEEVESAAAQDGFLLDGFPRTAEQASALEQALARLERQLTAVLCIHAPDDEIVRRLSGRRVCTKAGHVYNVHTDPPKRDGVCDQDGSRLVQRDDDREETIRKRLEVYHAQTAQLVPFYEERGLLKRFDGTRSPTEVHDHIRATIATLRLEDEL